MAAKLISHVSAIELNIKIDAEGMRALADLSYFATKSQDRLSEEEVLCSEACKAVSMLEGGGQSSDAVIPALQTYGYVFQALLDEGPILEPRAPQEHTDSCKEVAKCLESINKRIRDVAQPERYETFWQHILRVKTGLRLFPCGRSEHIAERIHEVLHTLDQLGGKYCKDDNRLQALESALYGCSRYMGIPTKLLVAVIDEGDPISSGTLKRSHL